MNTTTENTIHNNRFRWQEFGDTNMRAMHTEILFPPVTLDKVAPQLIQYEEEKMKDSNIRLLMKSIYAINGITSVHFRAYTIIVNKGVMFDWNVLMPIIERLYTIHLQKLIPTTIDQKLI